MYIEVSVFLFVIFLNFIALPADTDGGSGTSG